MPHPEGVVLIEKESILAMQIPGDGKNPLLGLLIEHLADGTVEGIDRRPSEHLHQGGTLALGVAS